MLASVDDLLEDAIGLLQPAKLDQFAAAGSAGADLTERLACFLDQCCDRLTERDQALCPGQQVFQFPDMPFAIGTMSKYRGKPTGKSRVDEIQKGPACA